MNPPTAAPVSIAPAASAPPAHPAPAAEPAYKRILVKLSGEALMGEDPYGINRATIDHDMIALQPDRSLGIATHASIQAHPASED